MTEGERFVLDIAVAAISSAGDNHALRYPAMDMSVYETAAGRR